MNKSTFLIIRLSSLGDIIHTIPAFSLLRKNFPDAKINWLVEKKGKEILDLVSGIDRVIVAQTKNHQKSKDPFWAKISSFKKDIKDKNQVAIDFQGLIKSAILSYFSGARDRIGFHRKNLREPFASFFYTSRTKKTDENTHVISKNINLLTILGIKEEKYEFPLSIPAQLTESLQTKLKNIGYAGQNKLVLFNVGAAWETKRLTPEKWIRVIEEISKGDRDHFPLLLWGNETEHNLAQKISNKTHVSLAPLFSIKEVFALIKESFLVVSGDTFALQAACALSTPVVSIFGPTNPKRNGPFNPRDNVVFCELDCSYCYKKKCTNLECLHKIDPEEVAEKSLNIMSKNV